jgi:anti-anti-sigma factor
MASNARILAISGELDMNHVPIVREQLSAIVAEKAPRVLLDLAGLTYIDSSGLALFIEQLQRVQSYGGKFALFGLTDSVRHILEIARLDQVFEIHPDQPSALAKG